MYKDLIKIYIKNLTPEIILNYSKTVNIPLTTTDANILYQFIMTNYNEILDGNETSFEELQMKLNPNLYQRLLKLYKENKKKYL